MRSWSLASKTTLLILVPILVQVLTLAVLVHLHNEAEKQLKIISRSQRVISLLNDTNNDVYELMYFIAVKKAQFNDLSELRRIQTISKKSEEHLTLLSDSSPDDSEIQGYIQQARALKQNAINLLNQAGKSYFDPVNGQQTRTELSKKINDILFEAMVNLLPNIAKKQEAIVNKLPEASAQLRSEQEKMVLIAAVSEILLSVVAALLLVQHVVRRIARLDDNAKRIAANLPLNPPDTGNDEIARLDQTIHQLSSELEKVSGRESLIVRNASDAIITLDKAGKIRDLNDASANKFGFKSVSELLGNRLTEITHVGSREIVTRYLDSLRENSESPVLQAQMLKKDGSIIDVSISTTWFAPEGCFFCIIHDVTEQLQAQRIKNEIVAMVSHDLKTPLSTVDYLLSTFQLNNLVNEAVGDDLKIARRNVGRIIQLVVDFLDIEKIESHNYVLKFENVKIANIFEGAREECFGLAIAKHIDLEFIEHGELFKGDFDAVCRILTNLVTNAINHSPNDSKVEVEAVEEADFVRISVRDAGPGLSKEMATKIFERFYQAPGQKLAGTSGLGLAICKLLVRLSRGSINIDSEPGRGSVFSFTVPKA